MIIINNNYKNFLIKMREMGFRINFLIYVF